MKPVVFNQRSLFFAVVRFMSGKSQGWYYGQDWDTCSLAAHIIWALFCFLVRVAKWAVIAIVACLVMVMLSHDFMPLIGMESPRTDSTYSVWLAAIATGFLIAVVTIVICVAAVLLVFVVPAWCWADVRERFRNRAYDRKFPEDADKPYSPSPILVLLRSWKDKCCFKVKFK